MILYLTDVIRGCGCISLFELLCIPSFLYNKYKEKDLCVQ
jgi:hypothetical protein